MSDINVSQLKKIYNLFLQLRKQKHIKPCQIGKDVVEIQINIDKSE